MRHGALETCYVGSTSRCCCTEYVNYKPVGNSASACHLVTCAGCAAPVRQARGKVPGQIFINPIINAFELRSPTTSHSSNMAYAGVRIIIFVPEHESSVHTWFIL